MIYILNLSLSVTISQTLLSITEKQITKITSLDKKIDKKREYGYIERDKINKEEI